MVLSPNGELAFSRNYDSGGAVATRISIVPLQTNNPSQGFELRMKEAKVEYDFQALKTRLGRILLRNETSEINESSKAYLRIEPSIDGLGLLSKSGEIHTGIILGGPRTMGLELHGTFPSFQTALFYRIEREKILNNEKDMPDMALSMVQRAALVQDAEIALKATSEKLEATAIFQLRQQGEPHVVETRDPFRGRNTIGSVDTSMPRSLSDYRTATQVKMQLNKSGKLAEWLIACFTTKNEVRYYNSSSNAGQDKNSARGTMMATVGFESSSDTVSTQVGLSGEYSSSKQFHWFGRTYPDGSPVLVKPRWTGWFSSTIKF
ncbi:MAG: hypothetical protein ACO3A4_06325 [Silvanigrellaceae bacterium]